MRAVRILRASASAIAAVLGSAVFLVWGFGIGLLGVPLLWKGLVGRARPELTVAAWMVVAGAFASMIMYDQPHVHVSSEWFFLASQFVLMVIAAPAITGLLQRRIIGALLAVVVFAGTAQAVVVLAQQRWQGGGVLDADKVRASRSLAERITPDSVVAVSPDEDSALNVLTGGAMYIHPHFYELSKRFLPREKAMQRRKSYEDLFSYGKIPDDLPEGRDLWVGLPVAESRALFADRAVAERVEDGGWSWIRLKVRED